MDSRSQLPPSTHRLSTNKASTSPAIWQTADTELAERLRELDEQKGKSIVQDAIVQFNDFVGCECSKEPTGEPPISFSVGSCRCRIVPYAHNTAREDFLLNYKQAWDAIATFWLRVSGTRTPNRVRDPTRGILYKFLTSLIEDKWKETMDKLDTNSIPSLQVCEFNCHNYRLIMESAANGAENASLMIIALLEMLKLKCEDGASQA